MSRTDAPHVQCEHTVLTFDSSPHAAIARYKRPTSRQRTAATRLVSTHKRKPAISTTDTQSPVSTFPAPLVLPNDDLALDPDWPAQTFQTWLDDADRNEVTPKRGVIYVAAPPAVAGGLDSAGVAGWSSPLGLEGVQIPKPRWQDVRDYLTAFYSPLPVRALPTRLVFDTWDDDNHNHRPTRNPPRYLSLNTETEGTRIRTRASVDGIFTCQLNLDDLLDAAIDNLPEDAFALLLLVEQDIYEDDDEFTVGRAYGGSWVAVVSWARYAPGLDRVQGVGREHAWPGSHCGSYVRDCCAERGNGAGMGFHPSMSAPVATSVVSPMQAALSAHTAVASSMCPSAIAALHLFRIARTTAHELGHCFGIDHCVYYACCMQGSGSLAEDARQPPFLCPVDMAKLMWAVGNGKGQKLGSGAGKKGGNRDRDRVEVQKQGMDGNVELGLVMKTDCERYRALEELCTRFGGNDGEGGWGAFGAWIRERVRELEFVGAEE